jgi:eukaryotic-like serine/threonine-protein kinase
MKCPKCHGDNPDTSRFCSHCAAPLIQRSQLPSEPTITLESPAYALSKGSLVVGKFRIIEEVGHGGMGIVYKAEDIKLKRSVALKFLPPHLVGSPELKERFLIEAQAAAALSHPDICVIHEVGESQGHPYIAMEYLEGETLRDRIRRGPLKTEEALDIAVHIAAGLAEAHCKGIIHRDIKSANIMVTDNGQAKVMDFGLAKLRGGSSLTRSQTTLGTVAYMSPEQARGGDLDQRTDIWSLGVVLYEMLTGRLPFRGDHDQAVIYSILHQEPESLNKVRPETAPELGKIVRQALAKRAAERYQTMEEFREDLAAVAEGLKPLKARSSRKVFGIRTAFIFSALVVVLALLLGLNLGGLRNRLSGGRGRTERAVKLAVLPFANLTGDPQQDYLNDGLTQEMIARLGSLHPQSLGVIARTSVQRYRKTEAAIDQIGRELGVDYVLEGSARIEAGRVRVSTELIQVRDQTQIWANTFERETSGILSLQNEVASQVAEALELKLSPSERARLGTARTVNPEAYEAALKGFQYAIRLTAADLETAEDYFELALRKDPNYAAAYAGIALVWADRQQVQIALPSEAGPKAKAAAQKAVALDDTSWEAHYALASILTWTDWDWDGAERERKRAIELNPNNGEILAGFSHLLMVLSRPDEALAQINRALELDPFNIVVQGFYAMDLLFVHRYDEAIAQARKALAMQPGYTPAQTALYQALFMLGRYEEALALDKADFASDRESLNAFERGFAEAGYPGSQKRWAELMIERHNRGEVPAFMVAMGYVWAEEKDEALEWLEKSVAERDPNMPYLSCWPCYDFLRSEPRFQALLRRVGLPMDGEKSV